MRQVAARLDLEPAHRPADPVRRGGTSRVQSRRFDARRDERPQRADGLDADGPERLEPARRRDRRELRSERATGRVRRAEHGERGRRSVGGGRHDGRPHRRTALVAPGCVRRAPLGAFRRHRSQRARSSRRAIAPGSGVTGVIGLTSATEANATPNAGSIATWSIPSGTQLTVQALPATLAGADPIVARSADGARVVTQGSAGSLQQWDVASGTRVGGPVAGQRRRGGRVSREWAARPGCSFRGPTR